MQAGDGLRKGTGFDRADQRQEESSQGIAISVVSNVMQTDGLLSQKQKGTMLPIFKSIQCSCDKGGTIVFAGFGGGRQCLRDEKNAASGSKGTFCNAKGKQEEKYGHWLGKLFQFLLASTEAVPKLSWREEVWMTLVIQKCTGENGKKPYEEFEQVLKRLPYPVKAGNRLQKIKKSL